MPFQQNVTILLLAAFTWGVGNAITGLTAGKYNSESILIPPLLIAIANTLGGLVFLGLTLGVLVARRRRDEPPIRTTLAGIARQRWAALGAGASKGLNTGFYVLSATHASATVSLVLESTYVVWTALFAAVTMRTKEGTKWVVRAVLLVTAAALVAGYSNSPGGGKSLLGNVGGLIAALSYATFVSMWARVTKDLKRFEEKLVATGALLTFSLLTLLCITVCAIVFASPSDKKIFDAISAADFSLQLLNGMLVVGVVYLLVTIGLASISSRADSSVLGSGILTLSIPFTLLTETVAGRVSPTVLQLLGVGLFMAAFVWISRPNASRRTERRTGDS
ncbi:hypothetical protein AB0F88_41975 [Streptosporangium sp. NPDC023963]|uniref:hypothetical protein n=1 Tax=Streptosporangium sp. NPDC023963 TaxID=3155608 RepID=UPI00341D663D